jgi:hypothetical protein
MNQNKRMKKDNWKITNIENKIRGAIWSIKFLKKNIKQIALIEDIPERTLLYHLDINNNIKLNRNNVSTHGTIAENLYYNPLVADFLGNPDNVIKAIQYLPNTLDSLLEGFEQIYELLGKKDYINVIITKNGNNGTIKLIKGDLKSLNEYSMNIRILRDKLFDRLKIPYDYTPSTLTTEDNDKYIYQIFPKEHEKRKIDIINLPTIPIDTCYSI